MKRYPPSADRWWLLLLLVIWALIAAMGITVYGQSIELINTDTQKPTTVLHDSAVLVPPAHFNLRYNPATQPVGRVKVYLDGLYRQATPEGKPPFSAFGDAAGIFNTAGTPLAPGAHVVHALAWHAWSNTDNDPTAEQFIVTFEVPLPAIPLRRLVHVGVGQWDSITLQSDTEYVLDPLAAVRTKVEHVGNSLHNVGIGAPAGTPLDQLPTILVTPDASSGFKAFNFVSGNDGVTIHDVRFDLGPRTNLRDAIKVGRYSQVDASGHVIFDPATGFPKYKGIANGTITLNNVWIKGGGHIGVYTEDYGTKLLAWHGGGMYGDIGGYLSYGACGRFDFADVVDGGFRSTCGDSFAGPSHLIRDYADPAAGASTYAWCVFNNKNGSPGGAGFRFHSGSFRMRDCQLGGENNRLGSLNNHDTDAKALVTGDVTDTTFTGYSTIGYGSTINFTRCHWRVGDVRPLNVAKAGDTSPANEWKPPPTGSFTDCDFYWLSHSGVMVSGDDGKHWTYTNVRATNPNVPWVNRLWPASGAAN